MSGAFNTNTTASAGKLQGAQVLVMGNLTEFKEKESGGGLGILTRRAGVGVAVTKAHVGMIIKLVDATTGEVLVQKSFDKKVTKVGAAGGGLLGVAAGAAFFKSKAMADAIEEAIIEVVQYISAERTSLPGAPVANGGNQRLVQSTADCAALRGTNKPTVMVVIPEQHITRRIPDPAGETEIIRKLLEIGYEVLDPSQVVAIRNSQELQSSLTNPAAAAELGKRFGSDIIIIGEAFSEFANDMNGMKSCRARVEARAIETATGKILATNGTHAGGVDIAENVAAKAALKNAGSAIADYFIDQLCGKNVVINTNKLTQASKPASPGTQSLDIVLHDVNFLTYRKLQKALKGNTWLTLVEQSYKNKTATMHVQITKTADDVVDFLISSAGSDLDVTDFSADRLVATLN